MQVKKYEAENLQEAIDTIKRELGPEAVILQTKTHRRGFGLMSKSSVEVTAAVSEKQAVNKKNLDQRLDPDQKKKLDQLPATKQVKVYNKHMERRLGKLLKATADKVQLSSLIKGKSKPKAKKGITATRYIDIPDTGEAAKRTNTQQRTARVQPPAAVAPATTSAQSPTSFTVNEPNAAYRERVLAKELDELKQMVINLKNSGGSAGKAVFESPILQEAFEDLLVGGLDRKLAFDLVKGIAQEGQSISRDSVFDVLAGRVMESTEVSSLIGDVRPQSERTVKAPQCIALVGPTGVGKTTTLAKIASLAIHGKGLKVGLINVDCYKLAAKDQLATYAKILNVPFRTVQDSKELDLAIQDFRSCDLILLDTTGRSQKDGDSLREMADVLHSVSSLRTELVLAATTRDTELYDMGKKFHIFRPDGVVFSKLDEALTFGTIYNVSQRLQLPLLYFTTGQKVPEDIEEATKERLAALILDL